MVAISVIPHRTTNRLRPDHSMDKRITLRQWRIGVAWYMQHVATAASRLYASMWVNTTTMLAAGDELQAATKAAGAWFSANPCPDQMLGGFVADFLNTCGETALTAQLLVEVDTAQADVRRRLVELLTLVDAQSRAFPTW
jgi:hypothetical protein